MLFTTGFSRQINQQNSSQNGFIGHLNKEINFKTLKKILLPEGIILQLLHHFTNPHSDRCLTTMTISLSSFLKSDYRLYFSLSLSEPINGL